MSYDDDDIDLFDDAFVSKRARSRNPELPPDLASLTDEEVRQLDRKHRSIRNRKRSTKKKPESTFTNRLRDHLFKNHNAVTTRVNAGEWVDEAGNTIRGAEKGTSDVLALIPITIGGITFGIYAAFECKSIDRDGDTTPAQEKFLARVEVRGGIQACVSTILQADEAIEAYRQALRRQLADLFRAGKSSA